MSDMTGSTPREIDEQVKACGRAEAALTARIARLLVAMARGEKFVELGFASLDDYAWRRLTYSTRKTRELVELVERAESLPLIRAAFDGGAADWTKLRTIARVATPEDEAGWLEKAGRMSSRELEREIAGRGEGPAPRVKYVLDLDEGSAADLDDAVRAIRRERNEACSREEAILELVRRGLAAGRGGEAGAAGPIAATPRFRTVIDVCATCRAATRETRSGPIPVDEVTVAMAACDGEFLDVRKPSRVKKTIPPRVKRHVLERDRRCAVPGCSGRDFVDVHHVVPLNHGGTHDPARLVTLCSRHHTAVHEGALRVAGRAPELRFVTRDGEWLRPAHVSVELSEAARGILAAGFIERTYLDDVTEATGLTASRVAAAATELELAGVWVRR